MAERGQNVMINSNVRHKSWLMKTF